MAKLEDIMYLHNQNELAYLIQVCLLKNMEVL